MEFKVREIVSEEKGVAEIEEQLLKKHEEEQAKLNATPPENIETNPIETPNEDVEDLDENKVLSYIEKRYNKKIDSFDELMQERNQSEELPEDVAAFMKFKKETNRGIDDFMKLNKDYDNMDPDDVVREYLMATNEGLDADDIETMMDEYEYDEDFDDESKIKKVKIERKKIINEAKKFLNSQKDKYRLPLESSSASMSDEDKKKFDEYRHYTQQAKTIEEENNRKRQWFNQKTDELFNENFKGFEFDIDNKKVVFSPGDTKELKNVHSNPQNFINKFLDETGLIKDSVGYHKSLAIAMNPEKFAKFFYEQGKSDATDDVNKRMKNVNMSEQRAPGYAKAQDGVKVREVNPDHGSSLKIRSVKKI